jgi:serine phosphatase RsbU (regulator of sigma subunit)
VAGGQVIGLVSAKWNQRPTFAAQDGEFLEKAGALAAHALSRALIHRDDQQVFEILHQVISPGRPSAAGIEVRAALLPASTIGRSAGGDWYDVIDHPDGAILMVGDVMGHGRAALKDMVAARLAARAYVVDDARLAGIVQRLDRFVREQLDSRFMTLVVTRIEDGHLRWARAGHPYPFIRRAGGVVEQLDERGVGPLGVGAITDVAEYSARLEAGDVVVLFTDGLIENRGEDLSIGLGRLEDALQRSGGSTDAVLESVLATISLQEHRDDICVVVATRLLAAE